MSTPTESFFSIRQFTSQIWLAKHNMDRDILLYLVSMEMTIIKYLGVKNESTIIYLRIILPEYTVQCYSLVSWYYQMSYSASQSYQMMSFLLGWVSDNEEAQKNQKHRNQTRKDSNTGSRQAGHEQNFHMGAPHIWDKCSRDTGNTNMDKRISKNAG